MTTVMPTKALANKLTSQRSNQACCILSLFFFFFVHTNAFAQVVDKIKGTSALINLQGQNLPVGSEWITTNDVGHKTGLVKIKAVRDGQAVGVIEQGIVTTGESLIPKPVAKSRFKSEADNAGKPSKPDDADKDKEEDALIVHKSKRKWGLWAGYGMDSMSFSASGQSGSNPNIETAALTGTGFQLMAFYDYPWSKSFTIRLLGGYDTFNGTYSAQNPTIINTNGGNPSTVSVSAAGAGGILQWYFYDKPTMQIWVGGGYTFDYVISTSINLYSLTNPTFMNYLSVGGGIDYAISNKYFIPAAIYYDDYLAATGITQKAIRLTAGFGFYF